MIKTLEHALQFLNGKGYDIKVTNHRFILSTKSSILHDGMAVQTFHNPKGVIHLANQLDAVRVIAMLERHRYTVEAGLNKNDPSEPTRYDVKNPAGVYVQTLRTITEIEEWFDEMQKQEFNTLERLRRYNGAADTLRRADYEVSVIMNDPEYVYAAKKGKVHHRFPNLESLEAFASSHEEFEGLLDNHLVDAMRYTMGVDMAQTDSDRTVVQEFIPDNLVKAVYTIEWQEEHKQYKATQSGLGDGIAGYGATPMQALEMLYLHAIDAANLFADTLNEQEG